MKAAMLSGSNGGFEGEEPAGGEMTSVAQKSTVKVIYPYRHMGYRAEVGEKLVVESQVDSDWVHASRPGGKGELLIPRTFVEEVTAADKGAGAGVIAAMSENSSKLSPGDKESDKNKDGDDEVEVGSRQQPGAPGLHSTGGVDNDKGLDGDVTLEPVAENRRSKTKETSDTGLSLDIGAGAGVNGLSYL